MFKKQIKDLEKTIKDLEKLRLHLEDDVRVLRKVGGKTLKKTEQKLKTVDRLIKQNKRILHDLEEKEVKREQRRKSRT